MKNKYEALFQPGKIGGVTLKNRFVLAPMGPVGMGDTDGGMTQRGKEYFTLRAKGGAGLLITGCTFVDDIIEPHGMPNSPSSTYNPTHFIRTNREMTERIHSYGCKIFLQMTAGFGRVGMPKNSGVHSCDPIAPSPISHHWDPSRNCRELTKEEIRTLVKALGEGAYNAKQAGFDGCQIHAVHEGYLLDQFALSMYNKRTDEYGGSLENRLRFAKEIVEEIKERCGKDFPVLMRYSPKSCIKEMYVGGLPDEEYEEKGRDLPEGLEVAKMLVSYGYDALDIDVGTYDGWWWSHPPMYQEKGLFRPFSKAVKEVVDVPILCSGRMDNPDMALEAFEQEELDFVGLARPLLADPEYVNKVKAMDLASIRPCLSCQEGCMGRVQEYSLINCAVNPQACREIDTVLQPILKSKRVMIVGGGVAGCEAARVLRLRGHRPEVFEKSNRLGGNLIPGGAPKFKEDDIALADWYTHTLEQLEVPIHYGIEVTKEQILKGKWDAVLVASGSRPKVFDLGNATRTFTAETVLTQEVDLGEQVIMIGGGLVGCETAIYLAQKGKKVTIVEALDGLLAINGPLCRANSDMLKLLVPHHNIKVVTNVMGKSYEGNQLLLSDGTSLQADSVVLAVGYQEEHRLYDDIFFDVPELYLLGDAKKVSNIMYAIWDSFEVANHL